MSTLFSVEWHYTSKIHQQNLRSGKLCSSRLAKRLFNQGIDQPSHVVGKHDDESCQGDMFADDAQGVLMQVLRQQVVENYQ